MNKIMKNGLLKLSFICITAFTLASCGDSKDAANGFKLKGTLSNASGQTLVLEQMDKKSYVFIDSAKVDEQGNFEFTNTKAAGLDFYRVKIDERNFAVLVTDSTQNITLTGDAKDLPNTYKVEGSPDTKQFIEINKVLLSVSNELNSLQAEMEEKMRSMRMDSAAMEKINAEAEEKFAAVFAKTEPELIKKVESFPSTIANFPAFNVINIDTHPEFYDKVLKELTKKHPNSFYTKQLLEIVEQYQKQYEMEEAQNQLLPDGQPISDIRLKNPEGKIIALSSLKGKVVLVDFWASWCGPCRKENPNVVKLYKKYKDKGFTIYSVSLDDDRDKWVQAIEKDGLTWNHVSDLGGWKSSVCTQFNISAIPFTILVGKDGKIIAKGLRGPALEAKLAELLGA
jgi:thiol-disulfide isomerase/thioredoxin